MAPLPIVTGYQQHTREPGSTVYARPHLIVVNCQMVVTPSGLDRSVTSAIERVAAGVTAINDSGSLALETLWRDTP